MRKRSSTGLVRHKIHARKSPQIVEKEIIEKPAEGRRDRNSKNYLSFTHGRPARAHITFEYRNGGFMFTSPDKMDKCNAKPIAVKDLALTRRSTPRSIILKNVQCLPTTTFEHLCCQIYAELCTKLFGMKISHRLGRQIKSQNVDTSLSQTRCRIDYVPIDSLIARLRHAVTPKVSLKSGHRPSSKVKHATSACHKPAAVVPKPPTPQHDVKSVPSLTRRSRSTKPSFVARICPLCKPSQSRGTITVQSLPIQRTSSSRAATALARPPSKPSPLRKLVSFVPAPRSTKPSSLRKTSKFSTPTCPRAKPTPLREVISYSSPVRPSSRPAPTCEVTTFTSPIRASSKASTLGEALNLLDPYRSRSKSSSLRKAPASTVPARPPSKSLPFGEVTNLIAPAHFDSRPSSSRKASAFTVPASPSLKSSPLGEVTNVTVPARPLSKPSSLREVADFALSVRSAPEPLANETIDLNDISPTERRAVLPLPRRQRVSCKKGKAASVVVPPFSQQPVMTPVPLDPEARAQAFVADENDVQMAMDSTRNVPRTLFPSTSVASKTITPRSFPPFIDMPGTCPEPYILRPQPSSPSRSDVEMADACESVPLKGTDCGDRDMIDSRITCLNCHKKFKRSDSGHFLTCVIQERCRECGHALDVEEEEECLYCERREALLADQRASRTRPNQPFRVAMLTPTLTRALYNHPNATLSSF